MHWGVILVKVSFVFYFIIIPRILHSLLQLMTNASTKTILEDANFGDEPEIKKQLVRHWSFDNSFDKHRQFKQ